MFIKKLIAGLFAVAMVFGSLGGVNVSANSSIGGINQGDFNQYCSASFNANTGLIWRSHYKYTYSLSTFLCKAVNSKNGATLKTWAINWNAVCSNKYGGSAYAIWYNCYR